MSDEIAILLEERKITGKGLSNLRAQGLVPAVVHDHGNPSLHVMASGVVLSKAFAQAGKHHPLQLKIGDKRRLALIKDVDFEPTKRKMRHVVFQAIKQNEKVSAEIPVVLAAGDGIPAEKKSLLVLTQIDTIEVEALPKDLPTQLSVDASVLVEVGDRVRVSDIKLPEGVTLLTDPELAIAVVEMPKDQAAEANAAAAEMAAENAEAEGAGKEEVAAESVKSGDEPTEGEASEAKTSPKE